MTGLVPMPLADSQLDLTGSLTPGGMRSPASPSSRWSRWGVPAADLAHNPSTTMQTIGAAVEARARPVSASVQDPRHLHRFSSSSC